MTKRWEEAYINLDRLDERAILRSGVARVGKWQIWRNPEDPTNKVSASAIQNPGDRLPKYQEHLRIAPGKVNPPLCRYQSPTESVTDSNNWNENERRVFIWFIIFYTYFKDISSNSIVHIHLSRPPKSGTLSPPPSSTRIPSSCTFNCSIWSSPPRKSPGPKKRTKDWWRQCRANRIGDGMKSPNLCSIILIAPSSKPRSIAASDGSTTSTTRRSTGFGRPRKTWKSSNSCYSSESGGASWCPYWKTHALSTWSRIGTTRFSTSKGRARRSARNSFASGSSNNSKNRSLMLRIDNALKNYKYPKFKILLQKKNPCPTIIPTKRS